MGQAVDKKRTSKTIKCFDCNGTGGDDDCYLCSGHRIIPVRRALKNGFTKDDLEEVYQGRCDCPSCNADSCELCDGVGDITEAIREREITRVLICGLTKKIPPLLERIEYRNGYSRVCDRERLLSTGAAWECKKRGWSWRLNSVFGHELYLYEAGKIEAQKRYPAWLSELSEQSLKHWLEWMEEPRRSYWDGPVTIPDDTAMRWADDGGRTALSAARATGGTE